MKLTIIGCGSMGSALAGFFLSEGHEVYLVDKNLDKCTPYLQKGAHFIENAQKAVDLGDVIFLAIKPKDLQEIATLFSIKRKKEPPLLLSLLAGVSLSTLKKFFPHFRLLRMMPNLAIECKQTILGISVANTITDQEKNRILLLLKNLGPVLFLSEKLMDSLTAISGSGLAFALQIMEAFIMGGIYLGFSYQEAREIALKIFEGASAMLRLENHRSLADLKYKIASPGGTTIYGLKRLEEEGVTAGIINSIIASFKRTEEFNNNG